MTPIPRPVRRGLLAALAAAACAASLTTAPAQAASAERAAPQQLRVTQVYAASKAIETGTEVRTSTQVQSVTRTRQPVRVVRLYLVRGDRAYNLTVAATPSLAPGARAVVRTATRAPLSVPAGRYAVRACFGPSGSQVCRTSRPTVVVGVARLTASPSALDFGDSPVGGPAVTREVTIENTGHSTTGLLNGRGIGQEGTGTFDLGEDACDRSLAPGQSCTVTVSYTPGETPGSASGELQVVSDSTSVTVDLTARTVAPADTDFALDPSSFDYGDVAVGGSVTRTFRIVNNTDAEAATGGFIEDNSNFDFDFDVAAEDFTCAQGPVAANSSCTFSVVFSPAATGPQATTAVLLIDQTPRLELDLTGTGIPGGVRSHQPGTSRGSRFGTAA